MKNEIFQQQLNLSLQRLEELWRRADQLPQPPATLRPEVTGNPEAPQKLLLESLTELSNSLEELQVIVEELHQQNHELNSSRLAVEAERQHYQELFEFAPDGYLVTTPAGAILEANQMAGNLLNISQKRLIGKPLVMFITAEERRNFYSKLNQLQKGELIKSWQVQMQRRRGACFTASIAISPIQNSQGKVERLRWRILELTQSPFIEGILPQSVNGAEAQKQHQETEIIDNGNNSQDTFTEDIQQQIIAPLGFTNEEIIHTSIPQLEASTQPLQRLNASLAQLENVLNDILSGACDFLFICDQHEKYIYVNQATANAWELKQSDFIGKSWELLKFPQEIVERLEAQQDDVFLTGRSFTDEISLITKEGLRDYEYTMTKISDSNGKLDAVVVIFRDITTSRQTITTNNFALEKNAEFSIFKSHVTSAFAQEIPHPLNNILAAIKLLESSKKPETSAQENQFLQDIQVNVRQINQLFDSLVLIEKIESEQLPLKLALIDLTEFCRKLIEELGQDVGSQYKITFIKQGKPCGVWDETLLRQTLTNLLINVINYSPQNSEIQLNFTCISKQVIFRIQNLWHGIHEAEQELLSHSFSDKIDNIDVDETEQNQLRLLIVKHCVELQKGSLFLERKKSSGSIITVILPRNQRAEKRK